MDIFMAIRSGIFFIAGIVSIIFRKQLNNMKNRLFTKLKYPKLAKDERKAYLYIGMVFILISVILFVYSITH
ncbi:hypothetical protein ACFL0V_01250 [Nanoarchaeota archaeon]